MDSARIIASSNWSHIAGCTFSQFVQECAADPDLFIKPHLKELVNGDKSILLSKEQSSEYCELDVKILSLYKIQNVSFVCNVVKVEVFQGPIKEYLKTMFGVIVNEPDDQFKSYRYDVEIEKSGISDLTLRFLTDSSDVCIFSLMLYTSPNPNGITTLLPSTLCANVQNILKDSTRKPNAIPDKCENLLELLTKSNQYSNNSFSLAHHIKQNKNTVDDESSENATKPNGEMLDILKSYIDERCKEFEMRIYDHLKNMEQRQDKKLDKILSILEKNM